jgi:Glycosyltransferase family 87
MDQDSRGLIPIAAPARRVLPAALATLPPRRLVVRALAVAALVVVWAAAPIPLDAALDTDAENFWRLDPSDPYGNAWGEPHSFVYSPAVAQVLQPFTQLPFDVFYRLLLAVNLACLWWLIGPWSAVALLIPVVGGELTMGNIHLPLAVMLAVSLSYPSAWAFGVLTKVTPGISILWWLGRRQWRPAMVAVATTAAIVAVSAALWPGAWLDWLTMLSNSSGQILAIGPINEWPAIVRVPIGAVLVVLAAVRNRPAALPLIVAFALPAIWLGSLLLALAVPRLLAAHRARPEPAAASPG